jgi:hypothetical protein
VTKPLLLGYWRSELPAQPYSGMSDKQEESWARVRDVARSWPDVNAFVDPNWPQNERDLVAEYLERGTLVNQYRGLSRCRFCKESNGSAELTDGSVCWPEGLAHYVWSHVVRLPKRFVARVQASPFRWGNVPRPTFPSAGQRDRAWPGPEFAPLLWTPDEPKSDYGLYVEVDPTWWLQQTGLSEVAR